jgi:hypothetical protein
MSQYVSSDYVGILIALFGGGIIAALLTAYFDRLTKKRQEHLTLNAGSIKMFSSGQPYYVKIASYYGILSEQIGGNKKADPEEIVYHIINILHLLRKFHHDVTIVQFDNILVESIVKNLMYNIYYKMQDPNNLHCFEPGDIYELRELVNEKEDHMSWESFNKKKLDPICKKAIECISDIMQNGDMLNEIHLKSKLCYWVIDFEVKVMLREYYNLEEIKKFYHNNNRLDEKLVRYMENNEDNLFRNYRAA